jgi:hypothetical protein
MSERKDAEVVIDKDNNGFHSPYFPLLKIVVFEDNW